MRVEIFATGGVGCLIAICPCVGIALNHRNGRVNGVVDGQVQCHDAVAARCVGQRVGGGVVALGVGHTVNPLVAFACHLFVNASGGIVHREGHGHYRVAAVGGRQDGILCAGFTKHHIIPCIGQLCLTDGSFFRPRDVAFLYDEVVHIGVGTVLAFTAQDDISCACIANRQSVSVPAIRFFSGDNCIAHSTVTRDEGQLGSAFNLAIRTGKDTDAFFLIRIVFVCGCVAIHIKEEIVVIRRDAHCRKHQFGLCARRHIRQLQLICTVVALCGGIHIEQPCASSRDVFIHPAGVAEGDSNSIGSKAFKIFGPWESSDGFAFRIKFVNI